MRASASRAIPGAANASPLALNTIEASGIYQLNGLAVLIFRGENQEGQFRYEAFVRSGSYVRTSYFPAQRLWFVSDYNNNTLLAATSANLTPETTVYSIGESATTGLVRVSQLPKRDANRLYEKLVTDRLKRHQDSSPDQYSAPPTLSPIRVALPSAPATKTQPSQPEKTTTVNLVD